MEILNTIPTAEEFLKQRCANQTNHSEGCNLYSSVSADDLIEFAKLHVETALKQACENAEMKWIKYTENDYEIDKDSILNSYPLENIK